MHTIRIMHLINSLEIGGAERVLLNLVNQYGPPFHSTVCCLKRSGDLARLLRPEVEVIEMHKPERNDYSLPFRLASLFRKTHTDIVHSHGWGAFCESVVGARLAGVPVSVHTDHGRVHEARPASSWRGRVKRTARRRVERLLARSVGAFVLVSDDLRQPLTDLLRVPAERLVTIPNGVPLGAPIDSSAVLRRNLGYTDNQTLLCSVGRLSAVKNFPCLLRAVHAVQSRLPAVRLILVGDGSERPALEQLTNDLGLSGIVRFLGARFDVRDILAACDLFVLSSSYEATSMAILEAMSVGLPVIATDVGGNRRLVTPQETGLLVPSDDPSALASAILDLAANSGARAAMGAAGRERVARQYSTEACAENYQDLYRRLLPPGYVM